VGHELDRKLMTFNLNKKIFPIVDADCKVMTFTCSGNKNLTSEQGALKSTLTITYAGGKVSSSD
jgi:hypothetical protein